MQEEQKTAAQYIKESFELKNLKLYKEAIEMLYKALSSQEFGICNIEIIAQIGDLYMLLKNYDRAIEQFEKVLDIDKNHIYSMHKLCDIYFVLKKYSKALEISQELCANSLDADNHINYFMVLYKLKMFDEIKAMYERLNDTLKKNPKIMYILSRSGAENREKLLQEIVENNPDYLEARLDTAISAYGDSRFEEAKGHLEYIISKGENSKAYYYLGLINTQLNEHFKAIDNFLKAIKFDKTKSKNYYFELAKAYIDINWLSESQVALLRSISFISSNTKPENMKESADEHYFLLSWVYFKREDFKGALLNLEIISENSPVSPKAVVLKNIIKAKSGNVIEAKAELEKLYEQNPNTTDNPMLYSALGDIYRDLKLYKKSIDVYKKGLSIFPNSFSYLSELVDVLVDDKNYDEAMKFANEFAEKYPNCPSAHNSLARIHYRLKDNKNAIEELYKFIELDKNNAEAYYFIGLILNDMGEYEQALNNLTIALDLDPSKSKYYAQIARSYSFMSKNEDAMLFIKEAIEMNPGEIEYKKQAATIASELGNNDESKFYGNLANRIENVIKLRKKL